MTKRDAKDDPSDADAFERAMADVVRLPPDPRGRVRPARLTSAHAAARSPAGRADDVDESDEDFSAHGVDPREIKKLKRGHYLIGGRLDLHGMTAADACARARRFVDNSRHRGHRCICLVHGRGLHSEGRISVLRARVRECLRSHRAVIAYADAPRSDGGAGAVYVLLRK